MNPRNPEPAVALPLTGIRVIEVASWVMAPSAGAILASFGADVVKVEPTGSGDPTRAFTIEIDGATLEPGFELSNSGKRGITLDLASDAGQEVLDRFLAGADVFLTNLRPASLERAGLLPETLHERYSRLVIADATGYGRVGAETGRAAFDSLAYWARSGIGRALAPDGEEPVQQTGAMGDLPAGVALLAGIMMALFARERGQEGMIVDASLLSVGMWTNGWELQQSLLGATRELRPGRGQRRNPLNTCYRCGDGRWVQFAMFQPGRYWGPVCKAIGRNDLAEDPRFQDFASILEHSSEARNELAETLSGYTLEELGPLLDGADIPWAPVSSIDDIPTDEQARANGFIVRRTHRSGREIDVVAPPFQLRGVQLVLDGAPEIGQHREELLLELGYDWPEIERLDRAGAF